MRQLIAIILLAWTWTDGAAAQGSQPIFRVTTQRVIVEFIAIDKDGKVVVDLSKDDITIEIDGKKQKVERLIPPLAAGEGASGDPSAPAQGGPRGVEGSESGLSAALQQQSQIRTVILLDSRAMDSSNFHHSRRAIRRFIAHSLQDDHFVMIAEIDRKLQVLTPFTRDREALLRAVRDLKPAGLFNPLDFSRLRRSPGSAYIDELLQQMTYLRSSLRTLMHCLSAYPGRKHVVLFSEGYPMNPVQELEMANQLLTGASDIRGSLSYKDPGVLETAREIVSWANAYGVTFYTVDARGLVGVPGLDAAISPTSSLESTSRSGGGSSRDSTPLPIPEPGFIGIEPDPIDPFLPVDLIRQTVLGDAFDAKNFLIAMAAGTNGSAFFNSNNLEAVLHASTREQRFVYLAAVNPELKDKGKVRFRRVKVKSKRKGVIVRGQAGFFNYDTSRMAGLRLGQAFQTPEFFQGLQPVCQVLPKGGKVEVTFGIDGSQISFAPSEKDSKQVDLFFLGQVYKKNGDPAFKTFPIQRPFVMDLTSGQYAELTAQPLLGHQELNLPAGQYRLVFVAEDRIAGVLGASQVEFTVN